MFLLQVFSFCNLVDLWRCTGSRFKSLWSLFCLLSCLYHTPGTNFLSPLLDHSCLLAHILNATHPWMSRSSTTCIVSNNSSWDLEPRNGCIGDSWCVLDSNTALHLGLSCWMFQLQMQHTYHYCTTFPFIPFLWMLVACSIPIPIVAISPQEE